MFNELGVKCTILERGERILKRVDGDAALAVQEKMMKNGIDIEFNVDIDRVDFENGKFEVAFSQSSKKRVLQSENVLLATGRIANVDSLGLEKIGVEYDKKGVKVDKFLRTTKEHIFACGDCIDSPKFAHTASYEANIVVHNMFAPAPFAVDYDKNSWVLFSDPEIAIAGIGEDEAKKRGLDVEIVKYDYRVDAKAQIDKAELGFVKFVIDKKSGTIIGVVVLNEDAASLSGEAALIVANKMNEKAILNAIHPHPTLSEAYGKLSQQIFFNKMVKR